MGVAVHEIKVFEDVNAVVVGDDAFIWEVPEDLDGAILVKVAGFISTAGAGDTEVAIRLGPPCDPGSDILTDKIIIESGECGSKTAATQPAVVADTEVTWGQHLHIDVDAAGAGALGLGVHIIYVPAGIASVTLQGAQGPPGGATNFLGPWIEGDTYVEGDVVSYGGTTYVAITNHTSGEVLGVAGHPDPDSASFSTTISADYSQVSSWPITATGVVQITKLTGAFSGLGPGSGAQVLKGVVYEDAAGAPGALLGVSAEITVPDGSAMTAYDLVFASPLVTAEGPHWLGFHAGAVDQGAMYASETVASARKYNADVYVGGAEDPFVVDGTDNNQNAMSVTYLSAEDTPGEGADWEDFWMVLVQGHEPYGGMQVVIDSGANAYPLDTVIKAHLPIPYDCEIVEATLLADVAGSCVVDLWVDDYGNFPPTDADSITGGTPLTLTAANKTTNTALTGWTTSLVAGDVLTVVIESVSSISVLTMALRVLRP